ncbi:alpha/beta hydrolase [Bacillus sp. S70]|uniref:Alpha/beta hydrolase n=3 Tax=Bacillus cereus group TaxID=86661 RepID=A0A9X7AZF9_BACTU|nr:MULTISPECIES: alpha/beta hydrolase [Bacillus]MBG9615538.1 acetyltransferase [Bacillus cereus]MBG9716790.1 acetyltransferase [Bacillus cereus]MBJ9980809.1 alpha/beta hydrolase [Bacillus sp. S29]MBK0102609.1 alpha/beta hydrolase [Bacillus sp. S70]MBK0106126.1 alpha/beta hydrolase [Bacillus sp. S73]
MSEKIFKINGIDICTESFGNSNDPAILLIMGATCSMIYWDEEFCEQLANTGKFVIRFDNRDVGRSVTYEPGTSNYSVTDMAEDAIGVLDAYHIDKAHFFGMSLGGMIAQIAAVKHPERILTLTLLATSVIGSDNNTRDLPPMDERILTHHVKSASIDWTNKNDVAEYLVSGSRLLCGSERIFDENRVYTQVKQEIERANNLLSMFNHALLQGDDAYEGVLHSIQAPTLVIHGTDDTALPFEHGLALIDEIPSSVLLTLKGAGHENHPNDWESIITAVSKHTSEI